MTDLDQTLKSRCVYQGGAQCLHRSCVYFLYRRKAI